MVPWCETVKQPPPKWYNSNSGRSLKIVKNARFEEGETLTDSGNGEPEQGKVQGSPNNNTPPFLYYSHENPLKYGNGMGSLWEGGLTIAGPWRNL